MSAFTKTQRAELTEIIVTALAAALQKPEPAAPAPAPVVEPSKPKRQVAYAKGEFPVPFRLTSVRDVNQYVPVTLTLDRLEVGSRGGEYLYFRGDAGELCITGKEFAKVEGGTGFGILNGHRVLVQLNK